MKIVKSLEKLGLLIEGVKEQKDRCLGMLISKLDASLLGNLLAGKGVIRAGKGTNRAGQDFYYHLIL